MKSNSNHGGKDDDLAFFGKMTASISHEIKNKLATIKEESGLMADLFEMSERGRPLDTARIKELMEKIISRVDEIDVILKRLNSFAHSSDEPVRTFDLKELLDLIVGLCQRFASMKKVKLEAGASNERIQVKGNPFLLQRLIYAVIDKAMAAAGEGGKITVSLREAGKSAHLVFTGSFENPAKIKESAFEDVEHVLEILGAALAEEKSPPSIVIDLKESLA